MKSIYKLFISLGILMILGISCHKDSKEADAI